MKAVILAAGAGTRLGALTGQMPKCLLPVRGKPLLDRKLDAMASAGITDVTVVAGFEANRVIDHVAGRCRVVVNEDYRTTNSIVSLHCASAAVRGDPFLFQNGDVLYSPDLMRRFVSAPYDNACLVDPLRPFVAGEYHVELDQGRIVRYSREVPPERSVGESGQLARIGAASSAAFLERIGEIIAQGGHQGFPNQAYDILMGNGGLWPVYTAGLPWWEIDTPEDYQRCQDEVTAPILPPPRARSPMEAVTSLLREPRIPYRLRWAPAALRLAMRKPQRARPHVASFFAGELTIDGLDLMINGADLLRLALGECERTGVHPLMIWGTLLGCVRDGGFIRGDHDIDLGILETEWSRIPALRDAMLQHGFKVRIENAGKLSIFHPRHPHLFVDFDRVARHRDGWAITNADTDPARRFHYRFAQRVFDRSSARPFAGVGDVLVPADPEGFLTAVYGDWKTPQPKTDYLYGPLNLEVEVIPAGERTVGASN